MTQYVLVYLGGDQPSTPEEGQQHFAKYQEWLSSLGDSVVSPANPFKGYAHSKPGWYCRNWQHNINVWLHDD